MSPCKARSPIYCFPKLSVIHHILMRILINSKLCIFGIVKSTEFTIKISGTSLSSLYQLNTHLIPKGYEISLNHTNFIAQVANQTDYIILNYNDDLRYDIRLELKAIKGSSSLSCQLFNNGNYYNVYSIEINKLLLEKIDFSLPNEANSSKICSISTQLNTSLFEVHLYSKYKSKKMSYLKIYIIISALLVLILLISLKFAIRCKKKVHLQKAINEKKFVEMNYCDACQFHESLQMEDRKVYISTAK